MLELAEVVRRFGAAYREAFPRLPAFHARAMDWIAACRTPALGGQLWRCSDPACGTEHRALHSCRHRACPACHGDQTRRWLEASEARWLPGPWLLVTLTLPAELRRLARSHQKAVLGALLTSAVAVVLDAWSDPAVLAARPAVLALLHTWASDLRYHPHVHLLVSAGGLDARGRWRVLSLGSAHALENRLAARLRHQMYTALRRARLLDEAPAGVFQKRWVADVHPAGDGRRVLGYLARYVHRVALANSRIVAITEEAVRFRCRRTGSQEAQECSLPPLRFLGRVLQHVPLPHFVRLRWAGIWAPRCRPLLAQAQLAAARRFRPLPPPSPAPPRTLRCPGCGRATLRLIGCLPRHRGPP